MEALARVLAYAGYTWMGFLFLFVAAAAVLDLYRLVILVSVIRCPGASCSNGRYRQNGLLPGALHGCLRGVLCPDRSATVRTEQWSSRRPKFQKLGPLRIVQISDVHLGLIMGKKAFAHPESGTNRKTGYPGFHR
jgi:hypothetical protein